MLRKRERDSVRRRVCERKSVGRREREREKKCVCVREREIESERARELGVVLLIRSNHATIFAVIIPSLL